MRYMTFALACAAMLGACGKPKELTPLKYSTIRRLLPQDFAEVLRDTHTFLVNVEPSPAGEIPGTRLVLTERTLESLKVAQPDVTRPIALYCEKDTPSDTIANQLARAGYSSVCFLSGGYRAWISAGLPFRLYNAPKSE